MSEYWGIPLLPFFSCAPAEKVPRFVFDFLATSVRHFDGVAEKAPCGLRKVVSSLVGESNKTRKKDPKAKLVLGGSGGWQMEVRDRDTKALGVNHVVIGECDHVIGDIYNDIESNNSPEFIHVPRGPKLEDIPDIQ